MCEYPQKSSMDFSLLPVVIVGGMINCMINCEFSEHVGLQRTHGIANAQACLNSA